jgi:hypothetical protein
VKVEVKINRFVPIPGPNPTWPGGASEKLQSFGMSITNIPYGAELLIFGDVTPSQFRAIQHEPWVESIREIDPGEETEENP